MTGTQAIAEVGAPRPSQPVWLGRIQRRTLRVLVLAQILAGAGLAAGVSVGALLAQDVLGSTASAGLPAALFTAGSAGAALGVGRLSHRYGRRVGLTVGYLTGAAGGAGVVVAGEASNVALLLVALTIYGAGTATNLQCRYAGADLADASHRGRAISTVLVATAIGAMAGPNLLRQTGEWAVGVGLPRLTGPFALASAAYATAGLVLATLLRPDPLLVSRQLAAAHHAEPISEPIPARPGTAQAVPTVGDDPALVAAEPSTMARSVRMGAVAPLTLAASGMVLAQAVMVAVMTMTPVHLEGRHHGLGVVGVVIALHIGGMYLPSPLTGRLVDRYTPPPVIATGGVVLLSAGLLAAGSGAEGGALAGALALLGLGWNLTLLGGTALVTSLTTVEHRARTQGRVDLGVALAGAAGGLSSGAIVSATSFETLELTAAGLALLVLPGAAASARRTGSAPV